MRRYNMLCNDKSRQTVADLTQLAGIVVCHSPHSLSSCTTSSSSCTTSTFGRSASFFWGTKFAQIDTVSFPNWYSAMQWTVGRFFILILKQTKTDSKHSPCTPPVVSCSSGHYTGGWLSWPWWGRSPAWRCSQDNNWQCRTLTNTWKTKNVLYIICRTSHL